MRSAQTLYTNLSDTQIYISETQRRDQLKLLLHRPVRLHRIHLWEHEWDQLKHCYTQTCQIHRILLWEHEWDSAQTHVLQRPCQIQRKTSSRTRGEEDQPQTCLHTNLSDHRILLWEHAWDQLNTVTPPPVRYTEYFSENTREISSNTVHKPVRYTEYFSETQTCFWETEILQWLLQYKI